MLIHPYSFRSVRHSNRQEVDKLEPIKLDFAGQSTPYLIYQQVSLRTTFRGYFNFALESGYNYLLRKITVRWAEIWPGVEDPKFPFGPNVWYAHDLALEFFANGRPATRQVEPIPANLFCTPSEGNTTYAVMGTPPIVHYVLTSSQPTATKLLNYFYAFRDNIQVSITGQTLIAALGINLPAFVDIVLHGYYVREMSLPENQGV